MILVQVVLFGILVASPAVWFRWWRDSRFSAYAWAMLVFMTCTAIVYLNFGVLDWWRITGLFVFVLVLSIARQLYARKRAQEQ